MSRFQVREESVAGTRQKVYAVEDTNSHVVLVRFSDKAEAEALRDKANERADEAGA